MTQDITLIGNTTSPFVRKVLAFAHAAGLADRIAVRVHDMSPTFPENPLGKIPALILPDGEAVIESELIMEELDALAVGPSLLPTSRAAKRRRAIASGALDCAVARIYESRRPEDRQWPVWDERQKTKVAAALDALEREAASLGDAADGETTTVGVTLGYLDFRFGADDWRAGRPNLTAWYDAFSKTPPMAETLPVQS